MTYEVERKQLEDLLLQHPEEDILSYGQSILKLVPELIVCAECEHGNPAHIYNVFEHSLHVVVGVRSDLRLKLAALFHDIGKPYVKTWYDGWFRYGGHPEVSVTLTKLILQRLGYEEALIGEISELVKYHDHRMSLDRVSVQEMVNQLGKENFERLLELQKSDMAAHEPEYAKGMLIKLNEVEKIYSEM